MQSRTLAVLFVAVALSGLAASDTLAAPQPPVFPTTFVMRGIFRLPYGNITEPFVANVEASPPRQSFSYYGGMDQYVFDGEGHTQYMQFPIEDKQKCFKLPLLEAPTTPLLPNLASGHWKYIGSATVNGQACDQWQNVSVQFNMTNTYDMYVNSETAAPVQLVMKGYDFIWSSHPDHYILDYVRFGANQTMRGAFDAPAFCTKNADDRSPHEFVGEHTYRRTHRLMRLLRATMPEHASSASTDEFRAFVAKHKKTYHSADEVTMRAAVFDTHKQYIALHNALPLGFTLGMNQQADLKQQEFLAVVLPKVDRPHANNGADRFHVPASDNTSLPSSVDWRLNGTVTGVQDQGVCGSCWTFGSCGSLEGAWQLKTGQLFNLAEQQLVDCAWGFNRGAGVAFDMGCGGGFASTAFSWIKNNGGIALENSYHYLMKNGWCKRDDKSSGVQVTGYVNVTSGSVNDLLDAVATVGPVAIAIDASLPSFRFYKSGVYDDPACQNGIDDLDHEVLAVGYGTESDNVSYLLVKNSWSIYWGDQGYIKIATKDNECGISTQATYALV